MTNVFSFFKKLVVEFRGVIALGATVGVAAISGNLKPIHTANPIYLARAVSRSSAAMITPQNSNPLVLGQPTPQQLERIQEQHEQNDALAQSLVGNPVAQNLGLPSNMNGLVSSAQEQHKLAYTEAYNKHVDGLNPTELSRFMALSATPRVEPLTKQTFPRTPTSYAAAVEKNKQIKKELEGEILSSEKQLTVAKTALAEIQKELPGMVGSLKDQLNTAVVDQGNGPIAAVVGGKLYPDYIFVQKGLEFIQTDQLEVQGYGLVNRDFNGIGIHRHVKLDNKDVNGVPLTNEQQNLQNTLGAILFREKKLEQAVSLLQDHTGELYEFKRGASKNLALLAKNPPRKG